MIYFKRFILMLQFLTTIPIPLKLNVDEKDFGKGLIFAPVVGLVIGGLLALAYYLLKFVFPGYITAVIAIIIYIVLTGGLHLDGLGDTFDGLFSNRSKERMLEIMRDSRVGTNAVLAIFCLLILNVSLLVGLKDFNIIPVLVLMPVAGRIGSLIGAGVSVYARSGEGLGKSFIDYCGIKEITTGTFIYLLIFYFILGSKSLMLSVLPIFSAFLTVRFLSRKIGGATGDILGAVCEINQTVFLIFAFIVFKYMF